MQLKHGKLSIALPSTWTDHSTLLFVGPPPASPTSAAVKRAQPSIAVTFGRAKDGAPAEVARALLDDELRALAPFGFSAIAIGPFACALGDGVLSEHRVQLDGVALRQLHVVVVRGNVAVRAVASAGDVDFAAVEPQLRSALSSLSFEGGAP